MTQPLISGYSYQLEGEKEERAHVERKEREERERVERDRGWERERVGERRREEEQAARQESLHLMARLESKEAELQQMAVEHERQAGAWRGRSDALVQDMERLRRALENAEQRVEDAEQRERMAVAGCKEQRDKEERERLRLLEERNELEREQQRWEDLAQQRKEDLDRLHAREAQVRAKEPI